MKIKPATPLPWSHNEGRAAYHANGSLAEVNGSISTARLDAAYIVHACNAYPRMVATLKQIARGYPYVQAGQGSAALLRELGEIE